MKINIYIPPTSPHHIKVLQAFGKGCTQSKYKITYLDLFKDQYSFCDILVTFGIAKYRDIRGSYITNLIKQHKCKPHIVLEKGYIHRDNYYAVGLNGLNGRANFYNNHSPPDRWNQLHTVLQPWQYNSTGHILLCGQVPWDSSVQHTNHKQWCRQTYSFLQCKTTRTIVFRMHPSKKGGYLNLQNNNAIYSHHKTLLEDLQNAFTVVTFNSNAGVEATIAGIPTFSCDIGSMVYNISNHDLANILQPQTFYRTQWAYNLAYAQWNLQEIEDGLAWQHIKQGI